MLQFLGAQPASLRRASWGAEHPHLQLNSKIGCPVSLQIQPKEPQTEDLATGHSKLEGILENAGLNCTQASVSPPVIRGWRLPGSVSANEGTCAERLGWPVLQQGGGLLFDM